jgi:hypothetical protein
MVAMGPFDQWTHVNQARADLVEGPYGILNTKFPYKQLSYGMHAWAPHEVSDLYGFMVF